MPLCRTPAAAEEHKNQRSVDKAGRALDGRTKVDDLQVHVAPLCLGQQGLQVRLGLLHGAAISEAPALGEPEGTRQVEGGSASARPQRWARSDAGGEDRGGLALLLPGGLYLTCVCACRRGTRAC